MFTHCMFILITNNLVFVFVFYDLCIISKFSCRFIVIFIYKPTKSFMLHTFTFEGQIEWVLTDEPASEGRFY